jgi:hypothetical protein
MPVAFQTVQVGIVSVTGPRTFAGRAVFGSRVISAGIAINGFHLDYVFEDHRINTVEVDTDIVSVIENTVNFQIECLYADRDFDDPYRGWVTVLVIAEVE